MDNTNSKEAEHKFLNSQPWYKDGLRFECQRCGSCCRGEPGVVWVNWQEIKAISEFLGISQEVFMKRYLRNVYERLSLQEYANGDCIMYDRGCTIYEVRPCQCRTFPFWTQNLEAQEEWENLKLQCPGIDKGKLHNLEEIRKNLKQYESRFV